MADVRRELGRTSEDAAAQLLTRAGMQVVARNVRFTHGEIDLVCRDGVTWVFVEVKSRRGEPGDPAEAAVTRPKQRRLGRLAQHFLKWKGLRDVSCRFDVVAVALGADGNVKAIRHVPAAFEVDAW
jgi:putative endonuclease